MRHTVTAEEERERPLPEKSAYGLRGEPFSSKHDNTLLLWQKRMYDVQIESKAMMTFFQLIFHRLSFLFVVLVQKE